MDKKRLPIIDLWYSKKLAMLFDKLTFSRILLLWLFLVFLFGCIYCYFPTEENYLEHVTLDAKVTDLSDCIYFSFISATTTGYGDIVPKGDFKLISMIEVVIGLMLLAVVTSRLVSIKQNIILNEIYEISLSDNVNRLRLSLSLFIQKLNSLISEIQEGDFSSKTVQEINFNFLHYEDVIKKIISLSGFENSDNTFRKSLNVLDSELLVYNLINAIERITIFFDVAKMNKNNARKLSHSKQILKRSLTRVEKFLDSFQQLDAEIDFENFISRKSHALKRIKKHLNIKTEKKSKTQNK